MNKFYFSALIIGLLSIAQGKAQTTGSTIFGHNSGLHAHSSFYAYPEYNNIVLRWQTSGEENIDRFTVEHSLDSIHFTPLHELVARGSDEDITYQDGDNYPSAGVNYYRLKVVNKDGRFFYSSVISIDMGNNTLPVLKPSVLNQGSTLRLSTYYGQPMIIDFFNSGGMRVSSYMVNSTSFDINTSNWGRGLYFYRMSDPTHPLINAGKVMIL